MTIFMLSISAGQPPASDTHSRRASHHFEQRCPSLTRRFGFRLHQEHSAEVAAMGSGHSTNRAGLAISFLCRALADVFEDRGQGTIATDHYSVVPRVAPAPLVADSSSQASECAIALRIGGSATCSCDFKFRMAIQAVIGLRSLRERYLDGYCITSSRVGLHTGARRQQAPCIFRSHSVTVRGRLKLALSLRRFCHLKTAATIGCHLNRGSRLPLEQPFGRPPAGSRCQGAESTSLDQ